MLDVDYWVERNFCSDADESILALAPAMEAERAALMADPEVARLHAAGVAWRKTRFAELMRQEPFRALFGRLLMTGTTRNVSLGAARFLVHHANLARSMNNDPDNTE